MELVEFGPDRCKDVLVKHVMEDTGVDAGMVLNNFTRKAVQHEAHSNFFPTFKDEAEVEDLLFSPQIEKDLSGDMMLLDSEHVREGLAIEDFTLSVDYSNTDFGESYSDTALMQNHDVMYEFVDSMFQGVDDGAPYTQSNFSSASPENIWGVLLFVECASKKICGISVLMLFFFPTILSDDDYTDSSGVKNASQSTSYIRNLRSELAVKSIERRSDTGEISDLSTALNSPNETHPDHGGLFHDDANTSQLPDAIISNLGHDISVKEKQSLEHDILLEFQNLHDSDNFCSPFQFCYNPNENEGEMIWMPNKFFAFPSVFESIYDSSKVVGIGAEKAGQSGANLVVESLAKANKGSFELLNSEDEECSVITNKRLRKRTQRYIEETFDSKSRCCKETRGPVLQKPRDLCTSKGHLRENSASMGNETISKDEILSSSDSRARNTFRCRRSEPPNSVSEDSAEEFRSEKRRPRKHHRVWTLPEVMKLVDGVSRYGVGKWTEIKRLLFPSSAFRTSVDLKDKWRNLLRASAKQSHKRNQVESHKKNAPLPIPQHVLRRIRELSALHPYPSDRKARVVPASSGLLLSHASEDDAISGSHGMAIRKCSFT